VACHTIVGQSLFKQYFNRRQFSVFTLIKLLFPFMKEILADNHNNDLEGMVYHPFRFVRIIGAFVISLLALISTTGLMKVSGKYLELEDKMAEVLAVCKPQLKEPLNKKL